MIVESVKHQFFSLFMHYLTTKAKRGKLTINLEVNLSFFNRFIPGSVASIQFLQIRYFYIRKLVIVNPNFFL